MNLNGLEKDDLIKIILDLIKRVNALEAEVLRLRKLIQGL
jgi:hypothetical protein